MSNRYFNKKNITTAVLIIAIIYFSFYFIFGRYGFLQYSKSKREAIVKKEQLETISESNSTIEKKIQSLKSSNIDKDLLDEQVRKNLGLVGEDEIIIYYE